jgi:hypothetical protein
MAPDKPMMFAVGWGQERDLSPGAVILREPIGHVMQPQDELSGSSGPGTTVETIIDCGRKKDF